MAERASAGWAAVLLAGTAGGCRAVEGGEPVTPQRPTFSSATTTTAPGTLELELGLGYDPELSVDVPANVKYGAGERTEAYVAVSPYRKIIIEGNPQGTSDVFLGVRHRFWEQQGKAAAAFQAQAKIPTRGRGDLSSGEVDFFGALIGDLSLGSVGVTGYYQVGLLGSDTGGFDLEHGFAAAASTPVAGKLGAFGELAYILSPEASSPLYTTLGLTWTFLPSLVADAGVAVGLNDEFPDEIFILGLTTNFGKL